MKWIKLFQKGCSCFIRLSFCNNTQIQNICICHFTLKPIWNGSPHSLWKKIFFYLRHVMAGMKLDYFSCKSELGFLWMWRIELMFWLLFTFRDNWTCNVWLFNVSETVDIIIWVVCTRRKCKFATKWTTVIGYVVIRIAEISISHAGILVIDVIKRDQIL